MTDGNTHHFSCFRFLFQKNSKLPSLLFQNAPMQEESVAELEEGGNRNHADNSDVDGAIEVGVSQIGRAHV